MDHLLRSSDWKSFKVSYRSELSLQILIIPNLLPHKAGSKKAGNPIVCFTEKSGQLSQTVK